MNTGLQDGANLSWRLAAAVQGWGPDDLLAAHEHERHPVGRLVVRVSGGMLRAVAVGNPLTRLARTSVMRVVPAVPPARRRVLGIMSGLGIRYGKTLRASDVRGTDGRRLADALADGRFVLVHPEGIATPRPTARLAVLPVHGTEWELVRPDGYTAATGHDRVTLQGALRHWDLEPESEAEQTRKVER